ncbi:DUF6600 domain-containing protein [Sandarakinorhabdus sp.]|uniref:DUF6600 domain-containing protein n=1 Tax=Sandarakinorhabdus sp. TaxID=1916663 RepID=UPI00286DA62D|nr:DUF6600 domain-containing protein [Sandarakinorhabdus sp.]
MTNWRLLVTIPMLLAGPALAQMSAQVPPPRGDDGWPFDTPAIAAPPMMTSGTGQEMGFAGQPGDMFGMRNVDDVAQFRAPLAQHGRWTQTRWGNSFVPDAPRDWRPYTNGQWGPDRFWVSDDPWGWATDHYGRWGFDEANGWVWVPGTEWAPSWTAWRESDDVAGWAPIPPGVRYTADAGFDDGWGYDNWNSWYAPSWVWVPRQQVFTRGFGGRVLPWNNGRNYWRGGRWGGFGGGFGGGWGGSVTVGFGNGGWGGGWNNGWGGGWNNGWGGGWGNGFGWGGGWNNGWGGGWNNGWGGGWGGGWNRPRWNHPRDNGPRRGQPGSVGDNIGRGIYGRPGGNRGDGDRDWRGNGGGLADNVFGRQRGGRGDGGRGDGRPRGGFDGGPRSGVDGGPRGGFDGGPRGGNGGGLAGNVFGGQRGGRGDGGQGNDRSRGGFDGGPRGGFDGGQRGGNGGNLGGGRGMNGGGARMEAPRMEAPRMQAPRSESPRMDSPRTDTPRRSMSERVGGAMSDSKPQ